MALNPLPVPLAGAAEVGWGCRGGLGPDTEAGHPLYTLFQLFLTHYSTGAF